MAEQKAEFKKVSVRPEDKRQFAIIAATLGKSEVDLFSDMLRVYQLFKFGKRIRKSAPKTESDDQAATLAA